MTIHVYIFEKKDCFHYKKLDSYKMRKFLFEYVNVHRAKYDFFSVQICFKTETEHVVPYHLLKKETIL